MAVAALHEYVGPLSRRGRIHDGGHSDRSGDVRCRGLALIYPTPRCVLSLPPFFLPSPSRLPRSPPPNPQRPHPASPPPLPGPARPSPLKAPRPPQQPRRPTPHPATAHPPQIGRAHV